MKLESEPVVVGAVGKVKIQPLLRDFQAEGESPALGLFHGAAFSTALLPTNSAKEPVSQMHADGYALVSRSDGWRFFENTAGLKQTYLVFQRNDAH